jgi:hypothetical protein
VKIAPGELFDGDTGIGDALLLTVYQRTIREKLDVGLGFVTIM